MTDTNQTGVDLPITGIDARGGKHAKVDRFFTSQTKGLSYGTVQFLSAESIDDLNDKIKNDGGTATCFSKFARGSALVCASIIPIGWFVLCGVSKYVKIDEIALAKGCDGSVFVLDQGCHSSTMMCRQAKVYKTIENEIIMKPVNLLRVLPGYWGIADINGVPVILESGRHFINNPLFNWSRTIRMSENYIQNGTVHIITVAEGKLGLVQELGVGHLLEPGRHMINNNNLVFLGFRDATDEYIQVLSKHRVMISKGRIGLAWDGSDAVILQSDKIYHFDNDLFKFVKSVDILDEVIEHGSIKIITVNEGLLGIAFDDGQLVVMQPGRHIIDKATFMFSSFLSTGQETLPIRQITSLSSDNVAVSFSASLTIQVKDATKAVTMLGRDLTAAPQKSLAGQRGQSDNVNQSTHKTVQDLPFSTAVFQANIRDRARLNLSIIIGNNKFTETFLSTTSMEDDNVDDNTAEADDEQGKPFKALVRDAFMEKFSAELLAECGVLVLDMSIEDIHIVNKDLWKALAQAAVKATELEMTRIDNDVEVTKAATSMNSLQIRAKGEALATEISARAESDRISILSRANADRVSKLNGILSNVSDTSKNREIALTTAKALGKKNTLVIFSDAQTGNDILNGNMSHIMQRQ